MEPYEPYPVGAPARHAKAARRGDRYNRSVPRDANAMTRIELSDDELGAARGHLAILAYAGGLAGVSLGAVALLTSAWWLAPAALLLAVGAGSAHSYFCEQHIEIVDGLPWLVTRFGLLEDRALLSGRQLLPGEGGRAFLTDGRGGRLPLEPRAARALELVLRSNDGYRGRLDERVHRAPGGRLARVLLAWSRWLAR